MNVNVLKALDSHVDAELAEARDAASRLMAQTVVAYQRVAELEAARDLRKAMAPAVVDPAVTPLRKEA